MLQMQTIQVSNLRLPSGSSADRFFACMPSHWLPRAGQVASIWGDRGNGVHSFFVHAWANGRDAALALVGDNEAHRKLCEVIDFEKLPKGGHLEAAFAYDPTTGTARILGYDIGRAYEEHGAKPHEICATADLMGIDGDTLVIVDWKTGHADLGPAAESWQLKILVLSGCRALGMAKARAMFLFLREDGSTHGEDDVAEFDAFDLDAIAAEISDGLDNARAAESSGRVETTPGDHCKYCECKASCPSTVGLIQSVMRLGPLGIVTAEHASQVYSRLEAAAPHIKAAYDQLEEFAKHTPFPIAGGKIVRQVVGEREELDAGKTLAVMRELHGEEVALKAMTIKATKSGIEEAVRPLMDRERTLKSLKEEALSRIEKAGGIKKHATCSVKAVRDKTAPGIRVVVEDDDGSRRTLPPLEGAA